VSDDRLQEGRGDLEGESDEADLSEVEMEGRFEDGVDGGQQRLHHIVKHVTEADRGEYAEHGLFLGDVSGLFCLLRDGLRAQSGFSKNLFIW
jgi:hypothetical protein